MSVQSTGQPCGYWVKMNRRKSLFVFTDNLQFYNERFELRISSGKTWEKHYLKKERLTYFERAAGV